MVNMCENGSSEKMEIDQELEEKIHMRDLRIDDWVLVKYDGTTFLGIVVNV